MDRSQPFCMRTPKHSRSMINPRAAEIRARGSGERIGGRGTNFGFKLIVRSFATGSPDSVAIGVTGAPDILVGREAER